MAKFNGGTGNNLFFGTFGDDEITDLLGNNTVLSLFGNKKITLGAGNDLITVGSGNDVIDAGDGHNIIYAGSGNNVVTAGSGNDLIISTSGNDRINAGDGANIISSGSGMDNITTGAGFDIIDAGSGDDRVSSGGGTDLIDAGTGDDVVYGGLGSDFILGASGNDRLYGDGEFEPLSVNVDFTNAEAWQNLLSSNSTELKLNGLTALASGGAFSSYGAYGLSILSPSDGAPKQGWTNEIDAYNDTPESVKLSFDDAQTSVGITLKLLYIEKVSIVSTERVTFTVGLNDGTSLTLTGNATATVNPGLFNITIDTGLTGGKLIKSIELTPDLGLPPGVKPENANTYNATHPYSEFTLAQVVYDVNANATQGGDDLINGGTGNDDIFGGYGNDKIWGDSGNDVINGGAGNNTLGGGSGKDKFVFDTDTNGTNWIIDFNKKSDAIVLNDGVTIVSTQTVGDRDILTLSNNGTIIVNYLNSESNWHGSWFDGKYNLFAGIDSQ